MTDTETSTETPQTPSTATPRSEIVPAYQGTLELLDAKWDLKSGRTARFRITENGHKLTEHPFSKFVQRRGRVGTRFRAAFIRVGAPEPFYVGEVMLAGGGNPLQSGMWVKFWFDDESVQHPFEGCTPRSDKTPGDLFDAALVEKDDDDSDVDQQQRDKAESFAREQHALSRYAALLGGNELFLQWLSETITFGAKRETHSVDWWKSEDHVARWIRWVCKVESRADLDRDPAAAQRFHEHVRTPYNNWRHTKED